MTAGVVRLFPPKPGWSSSTIAGSHEESNNTRRGPRVDRRSVPALCRIGMVELKFKEWQRWLGLTGKVVWAVRQVASQ